MRCVIIDKYDSSSVSGTLMFTKRLVSFLRSRGHLVHVLRFTNEKTVPEYVIPIPFHIAEPRSYIVVPSEKTSSLIKHHLKKLKPDIVYSYCGISPFDFVLPSLCHSMRIPIAIVWHQDFNYSFNPVQLFFKTVFWAYVPMCESSDLLHVFSDKLKKFYIRRGIQPQKILALPNGVNPDIYTPGNSQFAKKHGIKQGILFMGRLTLVKNPELLLSTFLKLPLPKTTKLVLIGGGDLEDHLREKYANERILFTGVIQDEEAKIDIMRSCSLFVQPSINEGMSLALLEAMSIGLPCITSDAGNNGDLMKHSGTIIPINSLSRELPNVLMKYLNNPKLLVSEGAAARKTICTSYREEDIFSTLVQSLQKTITTYASRSTEKKQRARHSLLST